MSHPAKPLALSDEERSALEKIYNSPSRPHREVMRAGALLAASQGIANLEIARRFDTSAITVRNWRKRFEEEGLTNFGKIAPGRGRKPTYSDEDYMSMIEMTLNTKPPSGDTHWSARSMAKECGMSKTTVAKVWKSLGIRPHRTDTFKLSNDPLFKEKLIDVVGLYLNPPEKALVLCVDEKSSIQALDRTQPSLPMKPGRAGTMTHDYKRHGTSTLFAALDVATGKVIARTSKRHRHQEFMTFLNLIEQTVPEDVDVHIVLDNLATHKHSKVKDWLDKHPRFTFHFTPTSSSWLNQVERFFGIITDKLIRRGVFTSVTDLEEKIMAWIKERNLTAKPFTWVADVDSLLEKIARARTTLETPTQQPES
ncbi:MULTISPECIES: IS630 family transposase [Actinotignum]|uniref:IS630 family transposase n=3 Tax=Actinotignum TaxID=1653174 RepID=UPI0026593BC8|nr:MULTISPECIES: IS630 family transposase [Actinotignum]MDE1537292.1 IS630 family transposase [Actinotignum schaalii]MDY5145393.1 IS630 family transposase [Actinotignum timonense]